MSHESPVRISRCPRCGRSIRVTSDNAWRPFCSERCKTIDLGDWFSERNRIPGKDLVENQDEEKNE